MTDEHLTDFLAERVMGWRVAPDRFIKSGRKWIVRWRFAPLKSLEDAFDLLDTCGCAYTMSAGLDGQFEAEVRVDGRVGKATGNLKPRTITIALARALGELPNRNSKPESVVPDRGHPLARSNVNGT